MSSPQDTAESEPYVHHAWVDESITFCDNSAYILLAVIADPSECPAIRDALLALRPGRQRRLHWYDEGPAQRDKIVTTIGALDIDAVLVLGSHVDPRRQERARRLCMGGLLHRLDRLEVSHVALESRSDALDRRDLALIKALRGSMVLGKRLRVTTADPASEPMLWIADAIAGAISASFRGNREWLRGVEHLLERRDLKIS